MISRFSGWASIPLALIVGLSLSAWSPISAAAPTPVPGVGAGSSSTGSLSSQRQQILSQYPDAKIPKVKVLQRVTTATWPGIYSRCLTSNGFPTKVNADGGAAGYVPTGQNEAYLIASYKCSAEYPLQAKYTKPLDTKQVKLLYTYDTGKLTKCLKKHGVVAGRPPSLATFEQNFQSDPWSPYSSAPLSDLSKLNKSCPQVPANLYR